MNAGIGDAINLSHKIKSQEDGLTHNLLQAYQKERLHVNSIFKDCSMKNYWKLVDLTKKMWLNKGNLEIFKSFVDILPLSGPLKNSAFNGGRLLGL